MWNNGVIYYSDVHNGVIYSDVHNGVIYNVVHNGVIYNDVHNGVTYSDVHNGVIYSDVHNGVIYSDVHNGVIHSDVHNGQTDFIKTEIREHIKKIPTHIIIFWHFYIMQLVYHSGNNSINHMYVGISSNYFAV